ncbi:MAG: TIGR02281 family clan AA aspartic protease, partial [Pseudomonadota bacterium]
MLQFVLLVIAIIGGAALLAGVDTRVLMALPADQQIMLAAAGIIFIVLVGSVIGSGEKLANVSRRFGVAIGFAISVAIAYEYRYELQDVASRVTAGLIPGSPLSRADADGAISVTVSRINSHFQTNATVNGERQNFIVDTGASAVVLTFEDARAAGYDVDNLNFLIPVSTAYGTTRAAPIVIDSLAIGDIERSGVRALVAQKDQLFENLLGMTFLDSLSGYDV